MDPVESSRWEEHLRGAKRELDDVLGLALDADTQGEGGDLTFTGMSTTLWRDIHLSTSVASLFRQIAMPTDPFTIPHEFG